MIKNYSNFKQNFRFNFYSKILFCLMLVIGTYNGFGSPKSYFDLPRKIVEKPITGKITDENGNPLPGVTVLIKGTTIGTLTNNDGNFSLETSKENEILVISFVGYNKEEIKIGETKVLNIVLRSSNETLDEVIVTGSFDKRTAMESSIAISVLKSDFINKQVPISAADLLRNVPGVYVNSSTGEIKNQIVSRGLGGYFYISMQEDGLPVTSAKYNNYGPDYFLRSDLTISKLEAVRGGTASILGNNAPGGIYNYVSRTGGKEFKAEFQTKYGLEGNGKNPYLRADFNIGGPFRKNGTITYNIGGFLREADGARYPGYKMNKGGQIKANILFPLKNNGSLKVYAKLLDDRNSSFEFLPTVNFNNPQLAPGVEQTNSVLIPSVKSRYQINESGEYATFNSEDLIHSKDLHLGINLDYRLEKGWNIKNNL